MKKVSKILTIAAVAVLIAGVASATAPNRGGSPGRTVSGPQGQGGQHGQGQQGQGIGQNQPGERGQQRGQLDRQRIQLTSEQRDCYQKSATYADRALRQARGMAVGAGSAGFGQDVALRTRDTLRDQVKTMLHEHDRLVAGFADTDRVRLEDHLRKLDRVRDRVDVRLRALDREVGRAQLDPQRFSSEARRLERELENWQKRFGKLGDQVQTEAG